MLTGVFRTRSRLQRRAARSAQRALDELIRSPALTPHRAVRDCEIGPFIVDYVFKDRSLVVELEPSGAAALAQARQRAAFLSELGYSVLLLSRNDVRVRPRQVLAQLKAALR